MKLKLTGTHRNAKPAYGQLYDKFTLPALIIVLTVIVGINFLLLSHAAAPAISAETENGTIAGTAVLVTDATASNGKAVQFKAAPLPPPPPPVTPPPPPPSGGGTSPSWNPHVSCLAVVTTLSTLLGTQKSSLGGATFAGGGFQPGVPDRRSTAQPCTVNGKPVFVEMHRLTMGACLHIGADGDWSCELRDPSTPAPPNADPMKAMHIEIDGNMIAKGWGPSFPPGGKLLDVQGFVFWDPGHTTATFHHYSGWELHSFTAWRLSP
jgi:hypothetical protein